MSRLDDGGGIEQTLGGTVQNITKAVLLPNLSVLLKKFFKKMHLLNLGQGSATRGSRAAYGSLAPPLVAPWSLKNL